MGRCQQSLTHYRLNRHRAVHQADTGVGGVAGGGGVRQERCVTAVTGGAGPGRRGRDGGPPQPCECPRQFRQGGARFPRQSDRHR